MNISLTGPMAFQDERIEKKGDNFETSIKLIFRDGKDNKTFVGKSASRNVWTEYGHNIKMAEFMEEYPYTWQKRVMKEEAKQAALSVFFKEVYGYTDTSDIAVDEFDRPRIDKSYCSDCLTIDLTTET